MEERSYEMSVPLPPSAHVYEEITSGKIGARSMKFGFQNRSGEDRRQDLAVTNFGEERRQVLGSIDGK
jgi:hypothetical protein